MEQSESKTTERGGQFHQHSTSSFYACRSQKRKKDRQLKLLFALLGSARVKAARKHVGEIDPRREERDTPDGETALGPHLE